jgi:hypothetical protein
MSSTPSPASVASHSDLNEPSCERSPSAKSSLSAVPSSPSAGQASLTSAASGQSLQTDWVGLDESISSAAAIPVSPSVSPELAERMQMTATSGRSCVELLHAQDPLGSFVKTLLVTSAWASTKCSLTWRPSATPRGRLLFRLVPQELSTDAIECGLLPTLTARDHKSDSCTPEFRAKRDAMTMGKTLPWTMGGLLNPRWCEGLMGFPRDHTALEPSEMPSTRRSSKRSGEQS